MPIASMIMGKISLKYWCPRLLVNALAVALASCAAQGEESPLTPATPLSITGGSAQEAVVNGDYVFVSEGTYLTVLNIGKPGDPSPVSKTYVGAVISDIEIDGDFLYVGEASGVRIFDISSPASPKLLHFVSTKSKPRRIRQDGGLIWILEEDNNIEALKLNGMEPPTPLARHQLSDYCSDFCVREGRGWVAAGSKVIVYNVSDPKTPLPLVEIPSKSQVGEINLTDSRLFVSELSSGRKQDGGVRMFDVATPLEPKEIGRLEAPGLLKGISVWENRLLAPTQRDGLLLFDISDSAAPKRGSPYKVDSFDFSTALSDKRAYLCCNGLHVFDVSQNNELVPSGFYATPVSPFDVQVVNDFAYLLSLPDQVSVMDVNDPKSPSLLNAFKVPGQISGFTATSKALYVARYNQNSFEVYDLTNPASPQFFKKLPGPKTIREFVFDASSVYIVGNDEIRVMDSKDPLNLQFVGSYPTGETGNDLVINMNLAFLAGGGGLQSIDIRYPFSPRFIGFANSSNSINSVALSGDVAYVSQQSAEGLCFDVSNPAQPEQVGQWEGGIGRIRTYRGRLYSQKGDAVQAYDLSDAKNPVTVATYPSWRTAGFDFSGNYLFVGAGPGGLGIYEIPPE